MGSQSPRRVHFQEKLRERYGLSFTAEEIDGIETQIRFGLIKQMTTTSLTKTAVFKYVHNYSTQQQVRIFIVAEADSGEVISVEKSDWTHDHVNKPSSQRDRRLKGRTKRKVF